jgi:hypothetical protein
MEIFFYVGIYPSLFLGGITIKLLQENIKNPLGYPYPGIAHWFLVFPWPICFLNFVVYSYISQKASRYYYEAHQNERQPHDENSIIANACKRII